MLEFLVKEMGFTIFAIEANFPEALVVNEYVLYGRGNPKEAIGGMYFWTWDTEEVLAMVEWMKTYNEGVSEDKRVKFYGFDMQFPAVAAEKIASALDRSDKKLSSVIHTLNELSTNANFSKRKAKAYQTDVHKLYTYLTNSRTKNLNQFPNVDYALLLQYTDVLRQYLKMTLSERSRDQAMAENVEWILAHEGESSKMMIWAHNAHVSRSILFNNKPMGGYLADRYTDQYYAIGFDFNEGSFQAMLRGNLRVFTVNNAKENSLSAVLSKANGNVLFFDFSLALSNKSAKELVINCIPQRSIGSTFSPASEDKYYIEGKLIDSYDGLIFVRKTTQAIPLTD